MSACQERGADGQTVSCFALYGNENNMTKRGAERGHSSRLVLCNLLPVPVWRCAQGETSLNRINPCRSGSEEY